MTVDQLAEFISKQMKMSHIYQPLLIRSLLDSGGVATVRQLARIFLDNDESQIRNYEKRIKAMPVRVLRDRGVVVKDGQLVRLTTGKVSFQERAQLKALCDERIAAYLEARGLSTWDYSLLEQEPVPETVRYKVLKDAGGRCELCGASSKNTPLHVDHILPRSKLGSNSPHNLQALCARCNLAKGNRDNTDFRNESPDQVEDCPFCADDLVSRAIDRTEHVYAVRDAFPAVEGHCLVIPIRHVEGWESMSETERVEADNLARVLMKKIRNEDSAVVGFNLGYNCGEAAGQTVKHAHMHLIPRRVGDVEAPAGGIRGAIPGKMSY